MPCIYLYKNMESYSYVQFHALWFMSKYDCIQVYPIKIKGHCHFHNSKHNTNMIIQSILLIGLRVEEPKYA